MLLYIILFSCSLFFSSKLHMHPMGFETTTTPFTPILQEKMQFELELIGYSFLPFQLNITTLTSKFFYNPSQQLSTTINLVIQTNKFPIELLLIKCKILMEFS